MAYQTTPRPLPQSLEEANELHTCLYRGCAVERWGAAKENKNGEADTIKSSSRAREVVRHQPALTGTMRNTLARATETQTQASNEA